MQWNPDIPLVVRGRSLDGKDRSKITSLFLQGKRLRNQNMPPFIFNNFCRNFFKLPNNLKRISLQNDVLDQKKEKKRFERKGNKIVLVSSKHEYLRMRRKPVRLRFMWQMGDGCPQKWVLVRKNEVMPKPSHISCESYKTDRKTHLDRQLHCDALTVSVNYMIKNHISN